MPFIYFLASMFCFVVAVSEIQAEDRVLLDESFSGENIPEQWKPAGHRNSFSVFKKTLRGVAAARSNCSLGSG